MKNAREKHFQFILFLFSFCFFPCFSFFCFFSLKSRWSSTWWRKRWCFYHFWMIIRTTQTKKNDEKWTELCILWREIGWFEWKQTHFTLNSFVFSLFSFFFSNFFHVENELFDENHHKQRKSIENLQKLWLFL